MTSRALVIAVFVLGVVAAGSPVDAQQAPKIPRIGFLTTGTRASAGQVIDSFRQGLRELGYVEGKTVLLEVRYAEGKSERLPELARELVGLKVNVIVATTDASIAAVKRETQTIPIVMTVSSDPAGTGLVASLARPAETSPGSAPFPRSSAGNGWRS